jgi:diguanylate cyclase (GGDEF)-like protein
VFNIVDEITREPPPDQVARCLAQQQTTGPGHQTILLSRSGAEFAIEDSSAPIRDRKGHILGAVLVFRDVTRQRRLTHEINYQATHDGLTGLLNRREFEHRLRRVLETAHSDRSQHALCFLDLDRFKIVNDSCGHAAGDELLRQLAELLRSRMRWRDTLARLGGDEFGLLLEHCPPEQAELVADSLRAAVEDFMFVWEGNSFRVGVSIGLVPIDAASGKLDTVLQAADNACYLAKGHGRNQVQIYNEQNRDLARQRVELNWVSRLQDALQNNRFVL